MTELKEGYKKSEIGVIPVEWEVVELKDIVEFKNGKGHEQVIDENGQYVVINSKFISTNGNVYKSSNSNLSPLKTNDITLVMSDIPNGKALAKCFYIDEDNKYTLNQRICSLTTVKDNSQFLFYRLNRNRYFLKFNDGVNQTNLRKNEVLECKIPLPPLKEQEKIADILSIADEKIDAIATQIEKAQTLKKGLLQKLLSEGIGESRENHQLLDDFRLGTKGDVQSTADGMSLKRRMKDSELGKIPESWEITTVGKSSKNFDGQRVPLKSEDRQAIQGEYPYYGAQGIIDYVNDYIFDGRYLLVAEDGENVKGQKYDIAFVVNGKFWVNNHAHILQANDNMDLYFISSILNHINIIKYVTGTGQPKLNKAQLNFIKIPLPPLKEQKQIAEILSTADEKLEVLRAKKQMYETLKKGLLQKLLSGEVRV